MALKITTPIGTDFGITSEAYVRISDYNISKNGSAVLRIALYLSEEEAQQPAPVRGVPTARTARNAQIGDQLTVSLMGTAQTTVTRTVTRIVDVETEIEVPATTDEQANVLTYKTIKQLQPQEITETVEELMTYPVPDLSSLEGTDIFTFGYSHLKQKLVELFGEENVVDC